jgi:hypothetical protein
MLAHTCPNHTVAFDLPVDVILAACQTGRHMNLTLTNRSTTGSKSFTEANMKG